MAVTISFVVDKKSGPLPLFLRLTDTSIVSDVTSAVDYIRLWGIKNDVSSIVQFFNTTSASVNYCISAGGVINDTYSISLSAIIP